MFLVKGVCDYFGNYLVNYNDIGVQPLEPGAGRTRQITISLPDGNRGAGDLSFQVTADGDWTITVGVEGKVEPIFQGSKDFTVRPNPLFDIRRYGTPEQFRAPRDESSGGTRSTLRPVRAPFRGRD